MTAAAWSKGASGPVLAAEEDWRAGALCGGQPDLFFGPENETAQAKFSREEQAKAICASCPVRAACLEYALEAESRPGQHGGPWGVYAGLAAEERAVLARQRLKPPARCRKGVHLRTPQNTGQGAGDWTYCKDCKHDRYIATSTVAAA